MSQIRHKKGWRLCKFSERLTIIKPCIVNTCDVVAVPQCHLYTDVAPIVISHRICSHAIGGSWAGAGGPARRSHWLITTELLPVQIFFHCSSPNIFTAHCCSPSSCSTTLGFYHRCSPPQLHYVTTTTGFVSIIYHLIA